MKTLALATIAVAVLALNMPPTRTCAAGRSGRTTMSTPTPVYPSFTSTDCMARQLNQEQLDTNTQILVPATR